MVQRLRHGMKDREFVMDSKAVEEFSLPRSVQPAHSTVGTFRASKATGTRFYIGPTIQNLWKYTSYHTPS